MNIHYYLSLFEVSLLKNILYCLKQMSTIYSSVHVGLKVTGKGWVLSLSEVDFRTTVHVRPEQFWPTQMYKHF